MYTWSERNSVDSEWLDASHINERELRHNLRDIRHINMLLGWTAIATHTVASQVRSAPERAWTLLDVASGSADIPLAVARWAQRAHVELAVTASDINPEIVAIAREESRAAKNMRVERYDALALPYEPGSVDIVLCTLALHHFAPPDAIALLSSMARVGRHVLVFDIARSPLAYAGAVAITRVGRMHPMTCHDAPLSVQRAYTPAELRAMARQAGLSQAKVSVAFPFRLTLSSPGFAEEPVHAL